MISNLLYFKKNLREKRHQILIGHLDPFYINIKTNQKSYKNINVYAIFLDGIRL